MSKSTDRAARGDIACKPFPWKCARCGARAVEPAVLSYSTDMEHDGRLYSVRVPSLGAPRCGKCGEIVLDVAANRQISEALRRQVGLLSPSVIRENREALALSQKEMASRLGIAEATLSRWETGGQIQQRALDKLLRLFFGMPSARKALSDERRMTNLGILTKADADRRTAKRKTRRPTRAAS